MPYSMNTDNLKKLQSMPGYERPKPKTYFDWAADFHKSRPSDPVSMTLVNPMRRNQIMLAFHHVVKERIPDLVSHKIYRDISILDNTDDWVVRIKTTSSVFDVVVKDAPVLVMADYLDKYLARCETPVMHKLIDLFGDVDFVDQGADI